MKQHVQTFSIGLFTAGIILLAVLLFGENTVDKTEKLSYPEMMAALEVEGYHVLSDEEYISLSVRRDSSKEENNSNTEDEQEQKEETKTFNLKIEPGLASSSISSVLEKNGIIDDAEEFNKYLEDNDYSQYVQIGTFKLTDEMSFNQLAEAITN